LENICQNIRQGSAYRRVLEKAIAEVKKAIYMRRTQLPEFL